MHIHSGTIAHVTQNPWRHQDALEILDKGALCVDDYGKIQAMGPADQLCKQFPKAKRHDHGDAWLLPGMVDGHIHFPQYYVTAAPGGQLLDWLHTSVFPEEARLADTEHARLLAKRFVDTLLAAGTTTAVVFGSQFTEATMALFDEAHTRGLRLVSGITLMDTDCPAELVTPADQLRAQAERILAHIADFPRAHYAVTPRFALSCSPKLMAECKRLLTDHPECYVQTHINESLAEIEAVQMQNPSAAHYLEVYVKAGIVGPRTILAHGIYNSDAELKQMAALGCTVCHCPASNAYLGSGLFPLAKHRDAGVKTCLGTDIGAGLHFSLLRELGESYKVQKLQGLTLTAAELLYLGTLAGAEALQLQDRMGNFTPGKDADFLVYRPAGYLADRMDRIESPAARLLTLILLGEPAQIRETWVAGRRTHPN